MAPYVRGGSCGEIATIAMVKFYNEISTNNVAMWSVYGVTNQGVGTEGWTNPCRGKDGKSGCRDHVTAVAAEAGGGGRCIRKRHLRLTTRKTMTPANRKKVSSIAPGSKKSPAIAPEGKKSHTKNKGNSKATGAGPACRISFPPLQAKKVIPKAKSKDIAQKKARVIPNSKPGAAKKKSNARPSSKPVATKKKPNVRPNSKPGPTKKTANAHPISKPVAPGKKSKRNHL